MIDELRLIRGDGVQVNSYFSVRQPMLGDIGDFGEDRYF